MKKKLVLLLSIILLASLIGCSNINNDMTQGDVKELVAKADYPPAVGFDDYDGKRAVWDNNEVSDAFIQGLSNFSADTIAELLITSNSSENTMYSPISLHMALALSSSGASSETQKEILLTMHMKDLGIEELEKQTGNLFRLIYKDNEIGKLKLANSLWLDRKESFKEDYLKTVLEDYYASLYAVDFSKKETEKLISKWIADNSNGTLKGSVPVNEEQILTIINTIYFYDEWTTKFDKNRTKEDTFHCNDGKDVVCDFMNMRFSSHGFVDGDGFLTSSLNLKNGASMSFYLPDEGVDVYDLISTPEKVKILLDKDDPSNIKKFGEVVFKVPKFSFGSTLHLKEALKRLGIYRAFEKDADFSGLTDADIVYISDIIQSTHISIDEKGCEASAYTQIDYAGSAQPKDKAEMILDRPFIFTIKGSKGVVLFIGIVNNPIEE
ncbi:serpin family protein [Wukongibacter baidiensis]|uniref:serpin family protein n=1 Tax=Wukongibacter baidiensis TaxID=1723361 RepID=UPI003D7F891E